MPAWYPQIRHKWIDSGVLEKVVRKIGRTNMVCSDGMALARMGTAGVERDRIKVMITPFVL